MAPLPPAAYGAGERLSGVHGEDVGEVGRLRGTLADREKTNRRGQAFHFEYLEEWIDPGRTIATIHIKRVDADGSRTTVFQGFKGRKPSGEGVYYHAVSPSGRGSRGSVILEGENLVTVYDGWTADGDVVRIRDVFSPVNGGTFTSRTFLQASPGADWRQVGEDQWRRLEG